MRLESTDAAIRFTMARVARLATASDDAVPHLVPVTFAVLGSEIVFAIDHKPKSTNDLKRLRNIGANPSVAFLADGYEEDWSRLWWVRADGRATVDSPGRPDAVAALRAKYPQYANHPPAGPIVSTRVTRWSGWSGAR